MLNADDFLNSTRRKTTVKAASPIFYCDSSDDDRSHQIIEMQIDKQILSYRLTYNKYIDLKDLLVNWPPKIL